MASVKEVRTLVDALRTPGDKGVKRLRELLDERKFDPNTVVPDNDRSLISLAAGMNRVDLCEELLHRGASLELGSEGRTPLFFAASVGADATVRWLIDHGANIHACDLRRSTPLHVACANNHNPSTAMLLLNAGADLYCTDRHDRIPWDVAVSHSRGRVATVLKAWIVAHAKGWKRCNAAYWPMLGHSFVLLTLINRHVWHLPKDVLLVHLFPYCATTLAHDVCRKAHEVLQTRPELS